MNRRGMIVGALLLAACAAPPPPPPIPIVELPPPPPIVASTTSPDVDAGPPAATPALTDPPILALPESAACVLTTAKWRGVESITALRFRAGGPVFASIAGGQGSLRLAVGSPAQSAGLEVEDAGLALRGYVEAAAVWLHPARGIVLGDAVIPRGRAKLGWASAKPGAVGVTFTPRKGVTLVQPPLTADLPCDALGLDLMSADARAAVPGLNPKKPSKRGLLQVGSAIPLATTPGGAPLANLTAEPGADAEVTLMETSGQHTRILWERSEELVFGWVPTSAIQPTSKPPSLWGYGSGSGSGFGRSNHPISTVVCPDDIPLMVEAGGERMTVGQIRAGARISLMDRHEETSVVVLSGVITFPEGVRVKVRAERLKDCPKAP